MASPVPIATEPALRRVIGVRGLAAAIFNITVGAAIFVLPAHMAAGLGGFTGPYLVGWVKDSTGEFALALVAGTGAIVIVILTALGLEAKGVVFGTARGGGPADLKTPASASLSLN